MGLGVEVRVRAALRVLLVPHDERVRVERLGVALVVVVLHREVEVHAVRQVDVDLVKLFSLCPLIGTVHFRSLVSTPIDFKDVAVKIRACSAKKIQ